MVLVNCLKSPVGVEHVALAEKEDQIASLCVIGDLMLTEAVSSCETLELVYGGLDPLVESQSREVNEHDLAQSSEGRWTGTRNGL